MLLLSVKSIERYIKIEIIIFSNFRCVALCGIIYVLFNAIYILAFDGTNSKGEEYIYWILDWKHNPGLAVGVLFGLTVVFSVTFCVHYSLAMLRDYCWKKICKSDFDDVQTLHNVTMTEVRFGEQNVP